MKRFVGIIVLLFVASLCLASDTLLVGQRGLAASDLNALISGRGEILDSDVNGLFRIAPTSGTTLKQLKENVGPLEFILPGDADSVDANDISSVRSHVAYLDAGAAIRFGPAADRLKDKASRYYRAIEYRLQSRVDAAGRFDGSKYRSAIEHRNRMPAASPRMLDPGNQLAALAPIAWSYVGPTQLQPPYPTGYGNNTLSGRKNGIAAAPSAPDTIYVASSGGGVWKSTDAGATFQPKSLGWSYMNTSSVAVHPEDPNTAYVGIGDYNGLFSGLTNGIMKTTDGGNTWTSHGVAEFGDSTVTKIVVDPVSPNIVIVLTAGLSGDIWRSSDSGETWSRTNAPSGDWQDIDRSAAHYVAVGASRVYESTDQGATWSAIPNPLLSGGAVWDIAVSKLDANRLYLVTSNRHVYRTVNLGALWIDVTLTFDLACPQATQNWSRPTESMAIDCGYTGGAVPSDIVAVGLQTITVSDDNGLTWSDATHSLNSAASWPAGIRDMEVSPSSGTQLLVAGTGGAGRLTYVPATNGSSMTSYNATIQDALFYTVTVHPTNRLHVMGGAEDLATPASRGQIYTNPWADLFDTTGGGAAFDLANPNIHYTSGSSGGVFRYSTSVDSTPDDISPGNGLHVAPLVVAGATGSSPTFGSSSGEVRVWNGVSWNTYPTGGGAIRTIAVSKHNTNRIYTGAVNGDIFRAGTLGTGFTKIDGNLPDRAIGGIAESPYSPDVLLVALQGTGFADGVYRCGNAASGSPTWTNISGTGATGLPAVSVNDVDFDPYTNVYYAATDIGVFVSPDAGVRWYNLNVLGLPNVAVNDLWVSSINGQSFLYAATYGRGIWRCFLSARTVTDIQFYKSAIYGGQQNTVTVKLNGSIPVGGLVHLTDDSGSVSVPPTVTVPEGNAQVTFTIYTLDPGATQTVTLTATIYKTTTTNSFVLHKVPPFTFEPEAANIYGGDRFQATIDLHQPAPIDTVILFSDNGTEVSSPTSTSILAGLQTKTVSLYTLPVLVSTTVDISARIANTSHSGQVTLHRKPQLATFGVSSGEVRGGQSATGTIGLEFAGQGGALTATVSDTSAIVTTPPTVTIPNGSLGQTFTINTAPVTKSVAVTVKVKIGTVTKSQVITITP